MEGLSLCDLSADLRRGVSEAVAPPKRRKKRRQDAFHFNYDSTLSVNTLPPTFSSYFSSLYFLTQQVKFALDLLSNRQETITRGNEPRLFL